MMAYCWQPRNEGPLLAANSGEGPGWMRHGRSYFEERANTRAREGDLGVISDATRTEAVALVEARPSTDCLDDRVGLGISHPNNISSSCVPFWPQSCRPLAPADARILERLGGRDRPLFGLCSIFSRCSSQVSLRNAGGKASRTSSLRSKDSPLSVTSENSTST